MATIDDATRASPEQPPPLGQRFFDNVHLLLALGIGIMLIVFTGWGIVEIVMMPQGTLP